MRKSSAGKKGEKERTQFRNGPIFKACPKRRVIASRKGNTYWERVRESKSEEGNASGKKTKERARDGTGIT